MKIKNVRIYDEKIDEDTKTLLHEIIYCSEKLGIAPDELMNIVDEYVWKEDR